MTPRNSPQSNQQRMIAGQVRCGAVGDERVLEAMRRTSRDTFVPRGYRGVACADFPVPLPRGQFMLTPLQAGQLLQALRPLPDERILEIGTGSGYVTACLAKLGAHVSSIELHPEVHALAKASLAATGIGNLELQLGDAFTLPALEYDIIALTGSLPAPDARFEQWLRIGGRLFMTVGCAPCMEAWRITRISPTQWRRERLFETVIPPLDHSPETTRFLF